MSSSSGAFRARCSTPSAHVVDVFGCTSIAPSAHVLQRPPCASIVAIARAARRLPRASFAPSAHVLQRPPCASIEPSRAPLDAFRARRSSHRARRSTPSARVDRAVARAAQRLPCTSFATPARPAALEKSRADRVISAVRTGRHARFAAIAPTKNRAKYRRNTRSVKKQLDATQQLCRVTARTL
ncbi:hypothetical protein [Sorangium sp. So ce513]|uniref:hypothetical protein n=1 Tax=Sorangium sp. So ce513 TaxID=3133315 RepID=UPI003F5F02A6